MDKWTKAVKLEQLVIMLTSLDHLMYHFARPNHSARLTHPSSPLRVLTVLRDLPVAPHLYFEDFGKWRNRMEGFFSSLRECYQILRNIAKMFAAGKQRFVMKKQC